MDVVYLITNKTKNKFYVGSKKNWKGEGTYWGSSSNEDFWKDFKTDEFIFEVLFEVERDNNNPKKLLNEEIKELIKRDVLKDKSYYNKCIPNVGFSTLGDKRPGVGGVPKGTKPWNTNSGVCSIPLESRKKGNTNAFKKRWENDFKRIVKLWESQPELPDVGKIQRNGRVMPYLRCFALTYWKDFPVNSPIALQQFITKLDKHKKVMNYVG